MADVVAPAASSEQGAVERTFLIADIRGWTQFTRERGDQAAARLARRFAELARDTVEARSGRVLELRGDEAMAVFGSPAQAVRAATELVVACAEDMAADPDLPLRVGVGVDVGEAVPVEGGFRGAALNTAARLCSKAEGGQVLVTSAVAARASKVEDVLFEPRGTAELKGFEAPVELIEALLVPRPPPAEAHVPGEASVDTLPAELELDMPLVGREYELSWLRGTWRQARRGHGRVVIVSGPQQSGKTRLAAELAAHALAEGASVVYAGAGGAGAALALTALSAAASSTRPTVLVLDDLDVLSDGVAARLEELCNGVGTSPTLIVGLARDPDAAPALAALVERADRLGDGHRSLGALQPGEIQEIAQLYAGANVDEVPLESIGRASAGLPGRVHEVMSEWAEQEATRRLTAASEWIARERSGRRADLEFANNVIGLKLARIYGGEREDIATRAGACPYKGLASFEESDARLFFGRESLVGELAARTVASGLLAVVGPSGSGKSSLVAAGLLPSLRAGLLPGSDRWRLVVIRPGEHPLAELEAVGDDGDTRLVLVVDQFEEVFTACSDEDERAAFIGRLTSLATNDPEAAVVVLNLRGDFIDHCTAYPALAELISANQVLVGPMTHQELRRAIELPARRVGLHVEAPLVDALVAEIGDEPGGLPLLSTALVELWQNRSDAWLRMEAHEKTGGVHGAVARLAESAFEHLDTPEREAARSILLRLVTTGDGDAVTRRRVQLSEFDIDRNPVAAAVLTRLTDDRLLTRSNSSVEVAHEALLREWPRFQAWLQEDTQGRQLREHITQAAGQWADAGREPSELYRGARLTAALDWAALHGRELNELEREFLAASRDAGEVEAERQRRTNRRLRGLVAGLAVLLLAAAAAGAFALISRSQAVSAESNAKSRALAAESGTQLAVEPERALLLAMAAERADKTPEAMYALRRAIDLSPLRKRLPSVGDQSSGGGFGPNVAFSPDGAQIAEGSWNGTIQLVDANTMEVRRRINVGGHAPWVAYNPAGSVLAVGADRGVVLLDPKSGRRQGTIAMSNIQGLQFSPDGLRLAAIAANPDGTDSKLVVWEGRTHRLRVIPLRAVGSADGTYYAFSVGFSPDGHRVVVGARNGLGVFDVRTGRLTASSLTGEQVTHAEYSPDGSLIAVTRKSAPSASAKTFRADLLDARTLDRRATIYRSNDSLEVVRWTTFSPDGTRVAFVAGDVFGIYSLAAHRLLYQATVSAPYLAGAGFSRDGRQFAVMAGDGSGAVYSASGAEQEVIDAGRINVTMVGSSIALGRDRVVAAYGPTGGSSAGRELAQAWSWSGLPIGRPLVLSADNCPTLGVEPHARFAYTGHARRDCQEDRSRTLRIWNIRSRRPVRAMNPLASAVLDPPALNRDGSRIAEQVESGPSQGAIDLLNTSTGETTFIGSSACGFSAQAVSDDGELIAAVDRCPNRLIFWKIVAAGAARLRLKLPIGSSGGPLRFSPNATRLAIANTSGRGNIAIVATETGRTITTLVGHSKRIVDLAYSPDGKLIVTGSLDGTARVWDPETGRLLRTLDHPVPVFGVAFSPDGRTIATMDAYGIIRLWDACTDCESPGALMALAKTRVTRQLTATEKRTYLGS